MSGERRDCACKRANHQHGTESAYVHDRCRCDPCSLAKRRASKRTAHLAGRQYTDPAPARTRVLELLGAGMPFGQIEALTGVNRTGLRYLIGDIAGRQRASRVRVTTAAAILAVHPTAHDSRASGLCDPTGTVRRLQALMAIGWPIRRLAQVSRISNLPAIRIEAGAGRPVRASTRAAVRTLYDELWDVDPRTRGVDQRRWTLTRKRAALQGWPPPAAWDDDSIDDPSALPQSVDLPAPGRVARRLALIEDVRELHELGESPELIAARVGLTAVNLAQFARHHMPDLAASFGAAARRTA